MKALTLFMSALILLSGLSCSKNEEGDLSIEMIGSSAMMIPSQAQSCTNAVAVFRAPSNNSPTKEIPENYFSYRGITLSWKNTTDTAYIVKMDLEFVGNFNYKCSINGDELLSLFYVPATSAPTAEQLWDGSLAPAPAAGSLTTKTSWSVCRIVCGGAKPQDPTRPFTATGTLTVKGFQRGPAPDYEEKPFKARAPIRIEFSP